jgi:hypothetical protein
LRRDDLEYALPLLNGATAPKAILIGTRGYILGAEGEHARRKRDVGMTAITSGRTNAWL